MLETILSLFLCGLVGLVLGIFFFNINQVHTVVIIPTFTKWAYQDNDSWYYKNNTIAYSWKHDNAVGVTWSQLGAISLTGMKQITDIELDANPSILQNYYRVILLHNEYVTHREYDAIMNHSKVFYAYPNALYRFVDYNEKDNSITLLGNTGINPSHTDQYDEFDYCFTGYKIIKYSNGIGFSCYPEYFLWTPNFKGEMFN